MVDVSGIYCVAECPEGSAASPNHARCLQMQWSCGENTMLVGGECICDYANGYYYDTAQGSCALCPTGLVDSLGTSCLEHCY